MGDKKHNNIETTAFNVVVMLASVISILYGAQLFANIINWDLGVSITLIVIGYYAFTNAAGHVF